MFEIKLIFLRSSRMLQFSQFVWTPCYSVWDVFNNFLLIDATDRKKISSDQKRFFIALSLYPLSFFANTPFKVKIMFFRCIQQGPTVRCDWLIPPANKKKCFHQFKFYIYLFKWKMESALKKLFFLLILLLLQKKSRVRTRNTLLNAENNCRLSWESRFVEATG